MIYLDFAINALVSGVALGSIYALLALGLAITLASCTSRTSRIPRSSSPGLRGRCREPAGLRPAPVGPRAHDPFLPRRPRLLRVLCRTFELRGRGNTLQSLTLFFGVALVIEIALVIAFGTDLRSVSVAYVGRSLSVGFVTLPYRFLVPALVTPVVVLILWLYLTRTHAGLALRAVAHDERALSICGISPTATKRHASVSRPRSRCSPAPRSSSPPRSIPSRTGRSWAAPSRSSFSPASARSRARLSPPS